MEYQSMGKLQPAISRIGLGGLPFGGHYGDIDKRDVTRTVRAAVDAGVTFFDTSPTYGNGLAETLLGEALGSDRDAVVIATKNGTGLDSSFTAWRKVDRATIIRQVETSLRRLRREYIDLYLVNGPDPRSPLAETMETLAGLQRSGKIRAIGFCTGDARMLREALQYGSPEAVLAPYSIVNRTIEEELVPFCKATTITIVACEPFCRGLLLGGMHKNSVFDLSDLRVEDKRFRGDRFRQNIEIVNRLRSFAYQEGLSLAQLALGWTMQNSVVGAALCGAKSGAQITASVAAADVRLTPEQIIAIDQIVGEDIHQQVA